MKKVFFIFIFSLFSVASFAQDSSAVANDVTVLYRKETSFGMTIHGSGLGAIFRKGTHVTAKKKRMFEVEFVSMRHPKQYKVTNPYYNDTKPFFFGKLNFVYIPRIGMGQQHVIFGKAERSGVEVRYNYFGGVDLGLTKPVYNDVLVPSPYGNDYRIAVTKQYDPHDPYQQAPSDFYGPGNYFKGFDKMKFYPGLYGKFSFSFEHSTQHQKLAIIEAGMVLDVFLKKIPIMANTENSQYYFNFYISILWGGKKND